MKAGRPELAGPCGPDPWYIEVVIAALNEEWKRVLADYRPEPFRNMV